MTSDEILQHLKGAKKTQTGWIARCPAHDDGTASLSITEGTDGRVLLHCHAGCDVGSICGAMGIELRDLFQENPETNRRNGKQRRIDATYDYTDESGKLIFQVVRYDPKGFSQRRPDPNNPGGWIWDLKGTRPVLYQLPEIIRTNTDGRTVFIAEGEKDCDALADLGVTATCNSGGAGTWRDEHTNGLIGARIIVLPDSDKHGRKHAVDIHKALNGKAESVRIIELPDRNGQKTKDPSDWISAGGTREELEALVESAPEWAPPEGPTAESEDNARPDKPEVLLPGGERSISETGRDRPRLGETVGRDSLFLRAWRSCCKTRY